jgi:hypothetical protein
MLSGQQNPRAALILRGGVQVGSGFSSSTGTEYDTSPIFEALLNRSDIKYVSQDSDACSIFCTYFPSLEELLALYSTDIRTIYYIGDITDERSVKFLNSCTGPCFDIIKLEIV